MKGYFVANEQTEDCVVAIIAAHNPNSELVETIRALKCQVHSIIVVDDGSNKAARPVLDAVNDAGATVIFQAGNTGIAAALNAGVSKAQKCWNPDFFLTLDQDSIICSDYVDRALQTLKNAWASDINVGFITAESYSGNNVPVFLRQDQFVHGFDPMQSGFLVPKATFAEIGYFDESFFIDGVDSEFTMRARTAGFSVLIGNGCTIEHSLGQRSAATFLGRPILVVGRIISYNYHSPSRVYYICRNGAVLTKRYFRKNSRWVLLRLLEESKAHALRLAFSPDRGRLIQACMRGFRDAFSGRMGRIPTDLEERLRAK